VASVESPNNLNAQDKCDFEASNGIGVFENSDNNWESSQKDRENLLFNMIQVGGGLVEEGTIQKGRRR
jgi:hypothetical protein